MKLDSLAVKNPIKRRDMGIAGALIVISQFISSFQSSQSVSSEISKFKEDFNQLKVDREQYFVRKTDLAPVLTKLDSLNEQLVKLNEKVASLKRVVRDNYGYDEANLYGAEGGDDIIGCTFPVTKFTAEMNI